MVTSQQVASRCAVVHLRRDRPPRQLLLIHRKVTAGADADAAVVVATVVTVVTVVASVVVVRCAEVHLCWDYSATDHSQTRI